MKKVFLPLLVLVILALSSCVSTLETPIVEPDEQNGVVKFVINNPNYSSEFSPSTIPAGTDSFAVMIRGLGNGDQVIKKDFDNSPTIEMSIKLPGGQSYDFYLMGRKGEALTCYELIENQNIPCGQVTALNVEMKPFVISYGAINDNGTNIAFDEPQYDVAEPRNVLWHHGTLDLTLSGVGFGNFFNGYYTGNYGHDRYTFDTWGNKTFYLYGSTTKTWYETVASNVFAEGFYFSDSDTITRTVDIYFPIYYKDDLSPYAYNQATYELWVPLKFGNLTAGILCAIDFDELTGDITVNVN